MPTPTEQLRIDVKEIQLALVGVTERELHLRQELENALKLVDRQRDESAALRRELTDSIREQALLRQRLDDHLKRVEAWDNRRWGLIVLMAGALLSLASGLIVTLARK